MPANYGDVILPKKSIVPRVVEVGWTEAEVSTSGPTNNRKLSGCWWSTTIQWYVCGLHSMLDGQSGITVVGLASSGKEGLQLAEKLNPNVVLLDLRMPDMGGEEDSVLRTARPHSKILVLTNYQLDEDIFNALDAGALGYLLKSASQEDVVEALIAVNQGKRRVPPALAVRLAERFGRSTLSARELRRFCSW